MSLLLASGKLSLYLGEMRTHDGQNHQICSSHFWSAMYFSVETDGTHSRGASFYSAGGSLGFTRASVGSIPRVLWHPVPQDILVPCLLLHPGHTGPFHSCFLLPRSAKDHSSPQFSINEKSSFMGSRYSGA